MLVKKWLVEKVRSNWLLVGDVRQRSTESYEISRAKQRLQETPEMGWEVARIAVY